ncbi:MAG: hypothetical protein ACE5H3_00780 [Planctomycetota bacterium]
MSPQEEKIPLRPALLAFLALLFAPSPSARACDTFFFSQEKQAEGHGEKNKDRDGNSDAAEEAPSVTRHSARIGGTTLRYTATAGTLLMKKEDGTPRARIFYVAYAREGVKDPSERPLTFCFNGGPGSSSVWLHMGAFGPRRVRMADEGWALPRPIAWRTTRIRSSISPTWSSSTRSPLDTAGPPRGRTRRTSTA